ncbi:uncharacterized protein G2W53_011916 [Senna tora]|uniref:Uncharacterized protein n=1 Tax=Senna tora TaxID=362788 RepID=A0A834TW93_9FABA|nr:uncharacterized protein G2W53_011916 [Senna tora]
MVCTQNLGLECKGNMAACALKSHSSREKGCSAKLLEIKQWSPRGRGNV